MIKKKHRFTTKQFERSFLRSKKIFIGDFTFFVSNQKPETKIAATVSKKNIKQAVHRNTIRRKMYEILRINVFPHVSKCHVICLYKGKTVENCEKLKTITPVLLEKIKNKLSLA